jgi:hypothetical protein
MHHHGDLIVAVNGIHLKGWDGREVFELMNILLKDKNTTELRIMLNDLVLTEKYSKTSDNEADVEIMSPSKNNNNNETQEMEAIDVSPTKSEQMTSKDEPITMDYEDNFEASQCYDEEEDVAVQQHQLAIALGSEVGIHIEKAYITILRTDMA